MGPKNELAGVDGSEKRDSENFDADRQINADQPAAPSLATQASPNDQARTGNKESSVDLSVSTDDRRILTALIDRTASQKRIIDDLRLILTQFAVPYHELDPRILEAIRVKLTENTTFEEASICVFGTPKYARKIRYWQNRWELQ